MTIFLVKLKRKPKKLNFETFCYLMKKKNNHSYSDLNRSIIFLYNSLLIIQFFD